MNVQTAQPVAPLLSERVRQRLGDLGVTALWLEPDGRAVALDKLGWAERLVIESPQFAAHVRQVWPRIAEPESGATVELWPGVMLAPMPAARRRKTSAERFQTRVLVALLLGPELLESEQFVRLCDANRLDLRAAAARVSSDSLVGPAEARRLARSLAWMQQDAIEIDRRHVELGSLSQQLGESYEELSLLYKLSTSLTVDQNPALFLQEACRELQQVMGLNWIALQLTDDEPRLNELVGRTFTSGPVGVDPATLRHFGRKLLLSQPAGSKPLIVEDSRSLGIPGLESLSRQLLVVSMLREDKPFGIVFGGDKSDGSSISSVDSKLCNSMASSLSIFLDNMILYEDMEAMFLGTLHALTASIDAKDSYTHGHSERVALMSRELARAAGLDARSVERVYISGLVHDVGKIGVPESVLCKAGQLTDEEFRLIKMHPEIGARILQDIRQMQDLIPGVLYHHERWDGRGYPHGLKADRIPIFGRVICLADSFDAMSSNRTYRRALKADQVLDEIRRCGGRQFDPQLAELFVKLDFTPFYELLAKHQRGESTSQRVALPTPPPEPKP